MLSFSQRLLLQPVLLFLFVGLVFNTSFLLATSSPLELDFTNDITPDRLHVIPRTSRLDDVSHVSLDPDTRQVWVHKVANARQCDALLGNRDSFTQGTSVKILLNGPLLPDRLSVEAMRSYLLQQSIRLTPLGQEDYRLVVQGRLLGGGRDWSTWGSGGTSGGNNGPSYRSDGSGRQCPAYGFTISDGQTTWSKNLCERGSDFYNDHRDSCEESGCAYGGQIPNSTHVTGRREVKNSSSGTASHQSVSATSHVGLGHHTSIRECTDKQGKTMLYDTDVPFRDQPLVIQEAIALEADRRYEQNIRTQRIKTEQDAFAAYDTLTALRNERPTLEQRRAEFDRLGKLPTESLQQVAQQNRETFERITAEQEAFDAYDALIFLRGENPTPEQRMAEFDRLGKLPTSSLQQVAQQNCETFKRISAEQEAFDAYDALISLRGENPTGEERAAELDRLGKLPTERLQHLTLQNRETFQRLTAEQEAFAVYDDLTSLRGENPTAEEKMAELERLGKLPTVSLQHLAQQNRETFQGLLQNVRFKVNKSNPMAPHDYFDLDGKMGGAGGGRSSGGLGGSKANQRIVNPPKAESPVWKELKNHRSGIKKNGETGKNERFYEWDNKHNDIEVYGPKGIDHLGSMSPVTGEIYKPPNPRYTIKDRV